MSSFATVFTTRALWAFLLLAGSLFAGLTACNSQWSHPRTGRYEVQGEIVSIDKRSHEIEIKHGDIPGLMPAMTMPYQVEDERALDKLSSGDQIHAVVVVKDDSMKLQDITLISKWVTP